MGSWAKAATAGDDDVEEFRLLHITSIVPGGPVPTYSVPRADDALEPATPEHADDDETAPPTPEHADDALELATQEQADDDETAQPTPVRRDDEEVAPQTPEGLANDIPAPPGPVRRAPVRRAPVRRAPVRRAPVRRADSDDSA